MNNDFLNALLKKHIVFAIMMNLIIGLTVAPAALASEERPDAYLEWDEDSYPTTGTGTVRVVDHFYESRFNKI